MTTPTDRTSLALAHLLAADCLTADADRLDPHVWVSQEWMTGRDILRLDPAVLDEPWSDGQRVLLQVACDIYNHSGRTLLSDVLMTLDRASQRTVLEALRIAVDMEADR